MEIEGKEVNVINPVYFALRNITHGVLACSDA